MSKNKMSPCVKAEYDKLDEVILYYPGKECRFANRLPFAELNKGIADIPEAQKEHTELQDALRREGVKIYEVKDILRSAPINKLKKWASLSYQLICPDKLGFARKVFLEESVQIEHEKMRYFSYLLRKDSELRKGNENNKTNEYREELIEIIIEGHGKILWPGDKINSPYNTMDIIKPAKDMLFQRDSQIITDKGIVQCRMKTEHRRNEVQIMSWIYELLGIKPIYKVEGNDECGFLEGGDYMPAGDFALIGCGLRSDYSGVMQLLQNKKEIEIFDFPEIAVFKYNNSRQSMKDMHLDTYLNIIGKNKDGSINALIWEGILESDDITIEIWTKNKEKGQKIYHLKRNFSLNEFFSEKHINLIKLTSKEQGYFATNCLTIDNNKVICPEHNKLAGFYKKLEKYKINFIKTPINALSQMYGAMHCMTNALSRDKRSYLSSFKED